LAVAAEIAGAAGRTVSDPTVPDLRRQPVDAAVRLVRQQGLIDAEEPVEGRILPGGSTGVVVRVTSRKGRQWIVKMVPGSPPSLLAAEAEGLRALGASGNVAVPRVHYVDDDTLVMQPLGEGLYENLAFWQRLGEDVAALQFATRVERHGWPHDNWLGSLPQRNAWDADGYRFFAEHRVLRFLPEPKVVQTLSAADLKAVERFCLRLPELIPATVPVLLHGDLWQDNVLTGSAGRPTLIDPAVWYGWAEIDVSMLWLSPRPAASDEFFNTWQEIARPEPGWAGRAPLLHVREMLSVLAQHGDEYHTADRSDTSTKLSAASAIGSR
jgi:fructosamine-3-kinase